MKGKSAKPAKPSKAAALQLLQQLAAHHCQSACADDDSASAAVAAALLSQDAGSAVSTRSLSSEPEVDTPADSQLMRPQPELTLDMALSSIQSHSEAEVGPRGRIAPDEEDERQGPAALAGPIRASSEDQEEQTLAIKSAHAAEFVSESELALASDCATASMLGSDASSGGVADKQLHQPSLSKVIKRQRRRMSSSQRRGSTKSDVVLALTDAQRQQWRQADGPTCNISTATNTVMGEYSSMSVQTIADALKASTADRHKLYATHDEQSSSQDVSMRDEVDQVQPSGSGQDEQQLWQNLAEALQDKQACQKLAQLTVTLLARM